jgi:DNA polymerase
MTMDPLTALRLQIEWGADEALEDTPVNRLRPVERTPAVRPPAIPVAPAVQPLARGTAAERAQGIADAADSMAALNAAIASFDGCALRSTATNTVLAEGPPGRLMLIGEAPSSEEDRSGRAFAGRQGAYLEKMLRSIGLQRDELLLAHLIPWRPPGDRPPNTTELAICRPFLMRLIALARPRIIVLLGSLASRTLIGGTGTRVRRGRWVEIPIPDLGPVRALPTHSIASLVNDPGLRRDAWADLRTLRRAIDALIAGK